MMVARPIPVYLWEYALQHAAYVHEQAPMKALLGKTPYEAWHGRKPNVAHLREFATPVYILLQGQQRGPKLAPRSKPYLFLGYDDGSSSATYYDTEMRAIHTSRNYRFPTGLPPQARSPEPILVSPLPALPCEGECVGGDTLKAGSDTLKQGRYTNTNKRTSEDPPEQIQRKLRTKAPVNYRYLNDPFPQGNQSGTRSTRTLWHLDNGRLPKRGSTYTK
jgi:hypothetical protein